MKSLTILPSPLLEANQQWDGKTMCSASDGTSTVTSSKYQPEVDCRLSWPILTFSIYQKKNMNKWNHKLADTQTKKKNNIESHFSNIDCFHGELVSSSFLKTNLGISSLSQLDLFCQSLVTNKLNEYIAFSSFTEHISHFKAQLVSNNCKKNCHPYLLRCADFQNKRIALFIRNIFFLSIGGHLFQTLQRKKWNSKCSFKENARYRNEKRCLSKISVKWWLERLKNVYFQILVSVTSYRNQRWNQHARIFFRFDLSDEFQN